MSNFARAEVFERRYTSIQMRRFLIRGSAAHMMRGLVKGDQATFSFSIVSDPGRPVLGTRIEGSILIQLTYGCRQAAEPSSRVRRVGLRMARPVF